MSPTDLLIVVALMSIIAAIAVPAFIAYMSGAKPVQGVTAPRNVRPFVPTSIQAPPNPAIAETLSTPRAMESKGTAEKEAMKKGGAAVGTRSSSAPPARPEPVP